MTTTLEGGEGSASHPGRSLPPGKNRYPLYRRMGGSQGRSGQVRKISPPRGFDPRTIQPVASRYTDWAARAHLHLCSKKEFLFGKNVGGGGALAPLTPQFAYAIMIIVTSNKPSYLHYGKIVPRQMQVNKSCRLLPSFMQVANKNIFCCPVKARTFSAAMLGSAGWNIARYTQRHAMKPPHYNVSRSFVASYNTRNSF